MVHIAQNINFYEQDYYTPSNDGFKVFRTPFGNVGIVICFDRHVQPCRHRRQMQFAGESLVIHPIGKVLVKANDTEQLLLCDIDLQEVQKSAGIRTICRSADRICTSYKPKNPSRS